MQEKLQKVQVLCAVAQEANGALLDCACAMVERLRLGKTPTTEEMQRQQELMKRARVRHDELVELTAQITGAWPKGEVSAEECLALCRQALECQQQSASWREFLRITSADELCAKELAPLQREVKTALEQPVQEKQFSWLVPFLQGVKDGPDAPEFDRLLEQVETGFPDMPLAVYRGLVRGKYALAAEAEEKAAPQTAVNKKEAATKAVEAPETVMAEALHEALEEKKPAKETERVPEEAEVGEAKLLPPLEKWRETQPSASTFKSDLAQMSLQGRFALLLLSQMGALTARQIEKFVQALEPEAETLKQVPMDQALSQLMKKNCAAAYAAGAEGETAYCLTRYAVGSLKKSTVKEYVEKSHGKAFLHLRVGSCPLTAAKELPEATLTALLDQNEQLIEYLQLLRDNKSGDFGRIVESVSYTQGGHRVLLRGPEGLITALLCTPGALAQAEGDALLCLRREEVAPKPGQTLYSYDGRLWSFVEGAWQLLEPEVAAGAAEEAAEETKDAAEVTAAEPMAEEASAAGKDVPREEITEEITEETAEEETTEEETTEEEAAEEATPAPEKTAKELSQALLERCQGAVVPTDEELRQVIFALLDQGVRRRDGDMVEDQLIQAMLLARCAGGAEAYPGCRKLFWQLHAATGALTRLDQGLEPLGRLYTGAELRKLFEESEPQVEGLRLAACFRAMFRPGDATDYDLRRQMEDVFEHYEVNFPSYPQLKDLFNAFRFIQDKTAMENKVAGGGFTDAVLNYLSGEHQREDGLKRLQEQARELLSFDTRKLPDMKRTAPMMGARCFTDEDCDLATALKAIAESKDDARELAECALLNFCKDGQTDEELVREFIDEKWQGVHKALGISGKANKLTGRGRKAVQKGVEERVELIQKWLAMTESTLEENSRALKEPWETLREKLPRVLEARPQAGGGTALWAMLEHLSRKLKGEPEPDYPFADLLRTGYFSLDDAGEPIIDDTLDQVRYFEPWRNGLQHIAAPVRGLEEVREDISRKASPLFDDLARGAHIGRVLGETGAVQADKRKGAVIFAELKSKRFRERLQMDYAYGRLDEQESETLESLQEDYWKKFEEIGDFGVWRRFLDALQRQSEELTAVHRERLRRDLEEKKESLESEEPCPLLERAEQLLRDDNLAVTEEYINRFIAGERKVPEITGGGAGGPDYFSDFLAAKEIMDFCQRKKGDSLKKFGPEYIQKRSTLEGWTRQRREKAEEMLESWPSSSGDASTPGKLKRFFRDIGLQIEEKKDVVRDQEQKRECYKVPTRHERFNKADYRHPIAAFGTGMPQLLSVVCLFGNYTALQLVNTVCGLDLRNMPVVLVDSLIVPGDRRTISQELHAEKNASFLVIDRALALYLATLQETERLPAMLQCTLPYTTYQPFTEGNGRTADEMFRGRVKELSSIREKNGACIVYGGRQLGKTALLQRAANLNTDEGSKCYALYISIMGCRDEAAFVAAIANELRNAQLPLKEDVADIRGLCVGVRELFEKKRVARLHLLLDEADNFLSSIAPREYEPLLPMVDLWKQAWEFKFVLAGLHNVCRAKQASTPNSVLGQLGEPLCIEPLSPADALQLFSEPLSYLGFQLNRQAEASENSEDGAHIETLLTNTNYFPGIVQFFGHSLVTALSTHYQDYYSATKNPPYTLKQQQLATIIDADKLNEKIRERIRMTLELDPRYFMLARCIAILYLLTEADSRAYGFSVEEITGIAKDENIRCLTSLDDKEYRALLDELVQMGILSRFQDKGTYRLRRHNLLGIIGSDLDRLEADIQKDNRPEKEGGGA